MICTRLTINVFGKIYDHYCSKVVAPTFDPEASLELDVFMVLCSEAPFSDRFFYRHIYVPSNE
jgi:hypothetical protein